MNKVFLRKSPVFFILSFLLFSCSFEPEKKTEQETFFSIASPLENWVYYDDTPIYFSGNINTSNIQWYSSLDGYLGKGNGLSARLQPGDHTVLAEIGNQTKTACIHVKSRAFSSTQDVRYFLTSTSRNIFLPEGSYSSVLCALDGSANSLRIQKTISSSSRSIASSFAQPAKNQKVLNSLCEPSIKDIRLPVPSSGLLPVQAGRSINRLQNQAFRNTMYNLGTEKQFFVINTKNQMIDPHIIDADLYYSGLYFTLWKPIDINLDVALLDELMAEIDTRLIPRVKTLWGEWADIDNDEKIALLLCPSINEEDLAIGYFNPADFFSHNSDPSSSAYNPWSNEMDILYIAIPETGENASSYSIRSIVATIAHELTHAITFTHKTWNRIASGENDVSQEALFLDEGLSHLSESLCGFGVSGGNLLFVEHFLENTALYSFCGPDYLGRIDNVGMRGAITLFLSWLFWEEGGVSVNPSEPSTLIDEGGISFLKAMLASSERGWNTISQAVGKPIDELFQTFIQALNTAFISEDQYQCHFDPATGEPLDVFLNMGIFETKYFTVTIDKPKPIILAESINLLPWSFSFSETLRSFSPLDIVLEAQNVSGSVYMGVLKK